MNSLLVLPQGQVDLGGEVAYEFVVTWGIGGKAHHNHGQRTVSGV